MGIMYQANASSSFYPGALDGVTAVVMIDVIVAIIYYFTVLFSEMAILYNEDNKRKQLEKAARQRGGKQSEASPGSKGKSARDASGGRLVDEASGEIQTGRLETNTNPLFLNTAGGGNGGEGARLSVGGAGGLSVEMVLAQRAPPPPETWSLFQNEFAALAAQLDAAKQAAIEARKEQALGGSGGGGGGSGGGGADDEDDSKAMLRKSKAQFAPATAGEGASSSAVKLKKATSKRASAAAAF